MDKTVIKIKNLSKEYRLGEIGGTTLKDAVNGLFAKLKKKDTNDYLVGEKRYKKGEKFLAVSDINLEIKRGEKVGIIGHNGAGKTTLLKLISRITAPTAGSIILDGRVASMLEVGTGFHPELTGRENVYMNGAILGMTKKEIDERIEQIIDFSEIREFIDTPVKRYSSGMYVKLAFSVAAHLDCEIMITDEILSVGDVEFQQKCIEKMRSVAEENGRTVLCVSHNMSTVRRLCDRVIVLEKGKIVFDGETESGIEFYLGLKNNADNPVRYKNAPRPSKFHGKKLFINSLEFLEKENPVYLRGEKQKLSVNFTAKENIEELKVSLIIKNSDGAPLGMAQTFSNVGSVEKGKDYTLFLEEELSFLAKGKYSLEPVIFTNDESGNFCSFDHPLAPAYFEIGEEAGGVKWNKKAFGSILLSEPRVITLTKND